MVNRLRSSIALAFVTLTLPGMAAAFTVYDEFGAFPDATFGGSGIPNDSVAVSKQIINGSNTIRLAMSATQRYSNPALTNNGAGIYEAQAGSNCGVATDPVGCPSANQGALWNWNFFIDIAGGGKLTDYQIDLYYDLNSAGPNALGDLSGLGKINITSLLNLTGNAAATVVQDSQNSMFNYLTTGGGYPWVTPPGGTFDPNAIGNYQFAITVSTIGAFAFPIDAVAMEVNVVPIPAAVWLFGSALGLLGWRSRKAA